MFYSGQKVGLYTLIAKLGRGGFGEVWLAEKRSEFVTKKVAVKLPHEGQVNLDAIRQEATLWEQASGHPNVLPIIDADILDGQVVIVSEYADGGSLADKLERDGKLSLKEAVEMTIGILNGLEFLHSRRIIHRDIKPQNILLQGKTPRLADFGISRAMQATMVSSAIIGTDAYMSPEAFDGKRNAQTDIWSVGVVLYQLIKGSLPFPQDHPSERMFAVLTKEFEPLPEDIPSDLRRIVGKALEKEPHKRYGSAEEMSEDLQKALIGIAHPTFAKTEVLIKPDLPEIASEAQTIQTSEPAKQSDTPTVALNNLTEVTEIKTVVNRQQSNQPANQTEPNSIVTQINPNQSLPSPVRETQLNIIWYAAGAIILLFIVSGILAVILSISSPKQTANSNKISSNSYYKISTPTPTPNPYHVLTPLTKFIEGDKYGYKSDKDKSIVIPAKYENAEHFNEGFAAVKYNGKWGHINDKDVPLSSFKYDYANNFYEGIAFVKLNNKWGAIDRTGKEIFPFIYEKASLFNGGLASVRLNGKEGYINREGKEAISFKYDSADVFLSGLAIVCYGEIPNRKCTVIDRTGRELAPPKYEFINMFYEDFACVELNDKYGFIDTTGKEVIPLIYDKSGYFSDGYAEMIRGDKKYKVDKTGKETEIGAVTPTP